MTTRRLVGAFVAIVLVAVLIAASRARVPAHRGSEAMIRVTLSARPARDEVCRRVSDEELAKLPTHMRQRVICEGITGRYRLEVRRDGELLEAVALEGGGLRRDRQIYHFSETLVPSGRAELEVRLARIDPDSAASDSLSSAAAADSSRDDDDADDDDDGDDGDDGDDRGRREREERERRVADAMPPSLELRETVTLAPREVLLVTYDRSARRLRLLRGDR
jgi:hypothetical protein